MYHYDMMFRQIIQFNPSRSWAITYTHMWNLSMRMPIPQKQNNFGNGQSLSNLVSGSAHVNRANHRQGNSPHNTQKKGKKPNYCWSFNKGLKCKFGNKCRFIERCSYCDSQAHRVNTCPKLEVKKGEPKTNN